MGIQLPGRENQNLEWKASWNDDYLKWLAAFANSDGGMLEIGRNDRGAIVGVANASQLLEIIPNKVRDLLGIIVKIELKVEINKEYLVVTVEAYSNAISYKGQYFSRSGSTIQELKGAALDSFLLRKWAYGGMPCLCLMLKLQTSMQLL